jgi:transposase InsO family protein
VLRATGNNSHSSGADRLGQWAPKFQSTSFGASAHRRGVRLDFIRSGKPVESTFIESFNRRLRDACLNQYWFLWLADARRTIESWRRSYNTARPHRGFEVRTRPSMQNNSKSKTLNDCQLKTGPKEGLPSA